MVGLLDLLCMIGVLSGTLVGSVLGYEHFGMWGAVGAGLGSLWLCWRLALFLQLQELRSVKRLFRTRTTEDLCSDVTGRRCLMLNFTLLELRSRGVDIAPFLDVVLELLDSEDPWDRSRGWAALSSAYPEWAANIPDYQPRYGTEKDCREKAGQLRVLRQGTNLISRRYPFIG